MLVYIQAGPTHRSVCLLIGGRNFQKTFEHNSSHTASTALRKGVQKVLCKVLTGSHSISEALVDSFWDLFGSENRP